MRSEQDPHSPSNQPVFRIGLTRIYWGLVDELPLYNVLLLRLRLWLWLLLLLLLLPLPLPVLRLMRCCRCCCCCCYGYCDATATATAMLRLRLLPLLVPLPLPVLLLLLRRRRQRLRLRLRLRRRRRLDVIIRTVDIAVDDTNASSILHHGYGLLSFVDDRSPAPAPHNGSALCGSQMCGIFRCLMGAQPYTKVGFGW